MGKEVTFLGTDGLLHCNVCKEALEVFYPKGSLWEGRKHHRQCACERNAHAENERYYKEKEHRELVNRNRNICFEEKEMRNWTFQNADEENRLIKIAKDYVANLEEMKRNHMGYLLWGPIGTGKSFLAGFCQCVVGAGGYSEDDEL